ncbi:hypothetical protein [uncultured Psychroserpens sp.]|jgi:hypothetical protein|uniref:hypothetical protein n=1 Tax=uncultured Psychroserpens sp. TaxID=255436 RepID=UPI0026317616|nr:hypothetical protein [uncultured Psychroserpens sp.]
MKNTFIKLCLVAFVTTLSFGFNKSDETKELTIEDPLEVLLSEVEDYSRINNNADVAFTITKRSDTYYLTSIRILESNGNLQRTQGDRFHIACFDDEGNETSYTICPTKKCAAVAILECADNGGCAEVCENPAVYIAGI